LDILDIFVHLFIISPLSFCAENNLDHGSKSLTIECKCALTSEFEMKYLGMMHYFLRLEVWQRTHEIFLGQGKYTVDILKRIEMKDCRSIPTLHSYTDGDEYEEHE
jgi:hypothetical protein